MQRRHAVELAEVQARLLGQVGAHVLVTDGGHTGDIGVVPEREGTVVIHARGEDSPSLDPVGRTQTCCSHRTTDTVHLLSTSAVGHMGLYIIQ